MNESFSSFKRPKPLVLIIVDGWGLGEKSKSNPIFEADLPTFKKMDEYYPEIALQASGISVGLPWGEPGNSEVGHMTIGSGKVIYQNMPRITMSVQNGEFYKNPVFLAAVEHARKNKSAVHLMGLFGKGSVHSSADHLYALIELMQNQKAEEVFLHIFTDGRDSAPTSAVECIAELEERLKKIGIGKIATIGGRYYGMDRNNNWDRIKESYDTMTAGKGEKIENLQEYLKESYKKEIFDEYIKPACVWKDGKPVGQIKENDAVIFFNYREDRARQITKTFVIPSFSKFPALKFTNLFFATMTQYEDNLPAEVAFPPVKMDICLGKILSDEKLNQFRISETEKFAHVTYFFNGGKEDPFPGEDRTIIPSKDVHDFSSAPEMSANEITEKVISSIETEKYDFILINFANADIVGHTGSKQAAIRAIETVDKCLDKIIRAVIQKDGQLLITADHGNVEEMANPHTGEKDTEHSSNPVPLWYITSKNHATKKIKQKEVAVSGLLSDIAPTILDIFKIKKPDSMTGESLLNVLKN